jgi:hypothetical protein
LHHNETDGGQHGGPPPLFLLGESLRLMISIENSWLRFIDYASEIYSASTTDGHIYAGHRLSNKNSPLSDYFY